MPKPTKPVQTAKANKAFYNKLKSEIYKREQVNHSRLFLFSKDGKWYKMSGNSLLIFVNEIAPKIPLKPNILPDTDYTDCIFNEGIITFRDIDSLQKKLEKIGVLKEMDQKDNVVWFELNFSVPAKRLRDFREILKEEQERAVSILRPDIVLAPELYTKIRHILKRSYEIARKMSPYDREVGGQNLVNLAKEITTVYLEMNKNLRDETESWLKIADDVEKLLIEMSIGVELKYLSTRAAASVGGEVVELKKILKRELKHRNVLPAKTR